MSRPHGASLVLQTLRLIPVLEHRIAHGKFASGTASCNSVEDPIMMRHSADFVAHHESAWVFASDFSQLDFCHFRVVSGSRCKRTEQGVAKAAGEF